MAQLATRSGASAVGVADVDASSGREDERAPLLRELISRSSTTAVADEMGGTLVLDVEVDGARYLLTRVSTDPPSSAPVLSPREYEIARMVGQGFTNKAIASVLEISTWTVSTHLRRIFAKIGVSTRAAMVAKVLQGPDGGVPGPGPAA